MEVKDTDLAYAEAKSQELAEKFGSVLNEKGVGMGVAVLTMFVTATLLSLANDPTKMDEILDNFTRRAKYVVKLMLEDAAVQKSLLEKALREAEPKGNG